MQPASASSLIVLAFAVEGGLAVVAMLAGWWLDRDPFLGFSLERDAADGNLRALGWGVLACLPLLGIFGLVDRLPLRAFERIRRLLQQQLLPMFAAATPLERALICAAAGFGEELLFRGLLQGTLQTLGTSPADTLHAVLLAGICFGMCHWVTTTYAVLASIVGIYLGWLLVATDNILAPIVCHGLYDYLAVSLLLARNKNRQPSPDDSAAGRSL